MTRTAFRTALEEILDVASGSLNDTDTRDTIATWSSLTDVKIMTLIESELHQELDAALLEAESVADLIAILEQRQAFSG